MFCIGFTSKRSNQIRKTSYAQSQQVRRIRAKMVKIMAEHASSTDLKGLVQELIPENMGKEIEKQCQGIYPLHNVYIRKVKMLSKPKFDLTKIMEMHEETAAEASAKLEKEAGDQLVQTLAGTGGRL